MATQPEFSLCCLLCFSALLRISEALLRKAGDFVKGEHTYSVCLGYTKIGKRKGFMEYVTITDHYLVGCLDAMLTGKLPGDRLFSFEYREFCCLFVEGLDALHIRYLGFKTHSLRRGGATQLFRECGSFDVVAERGRWHTLTACRLYVQDSVAALVQLALSSRAVGIINKYAYKLAH